MPETVIDVARPLPGEFGAAFAGYIGRAPEVTDAARLLASQRDAVKMLFSRLSDAQADSRYAPDKWSVKEMLGHLSDTERILSYRMLRIGRGDATPLAGFEEDDYVREAHSGRRALPDLVEEFVAVRDATGALVRGMPSDAWTRSGTANGKLITARALLYIIVGHVEHHRHILGERYGIDEATK